MTIELKNNTGISRASNRSLVILVCIALFCMLGAPAFAQEDDDECLPGLPCVKKLTTNVNFLDDTIPANDPDEAGENANKSTSNTCDADFMNQIYNKAYLEAEEENVQLETLLPKPDSVLEYSCFENALEVTAEHAPIIFSETKRFHYDYALDDDHTYSQLLMDGNEDDDYEPEADKDIDNDPFWEDDDNYYHLEVFMGLDDNANDDSDYEETYLGNTLEEMILSALKSADSDDDAASNYIDANFSHSFLGGQTMLFNSHGNIADGLGDNSNASGIMGKIGNAVDLGLMDGEITFEGELNDKNNAELGLSSLTNLDNLPNLCAHMRIVWYMAKCRGGELGRFGLRPTMSVPADPVTNTVLGFAEGAVAGADTRIYPYPKDNLKGCEGVEDITAGSIANTRNIRVLGVPVYAFFDPSRYIPTTLFPNFFNKYTALGDDGPSSCYRPVPTGVVVTTYQYEMGGFHTLRESDTHDEYICINPGCHYDVDNKECVEN